MRISPEVWAILSDEAKKVLKEGIPITVKRVEGLSKSGAHGKYYKGKDRIELDKNAGSGTLNHELRHAFWDQLQRQHKLTSMPGLYGLLGFKGNPHKNNPFEDANGDPKVNNTDESALLDHFIIYKGQMPENSEYANISRQRMLKSRPDRLYAEELRKKLLNLWQPPQKERSR